MWKCGNVEICVERFNRQRTNLGSLEMWKSVKNLGRSRMLVISLRSANQGFMFSCQSVFLIELEEITI